MNVYLKKGYFKYGKYTYDANYNQKLLFNIFPVIIYKLFLEEKTPSGIARYLTLSRIPILGGKEIWQASTVSSILKNEKYKGDAILQKSFTIDFLTKKNKINEGEIPQYYVENSHPAIITPEVFDLVKHEIKK